MENTNKGEIQLIDPKRTSLVPVKQPKKAKRKHPKLHRILDEAAAGFGWILTGFVAGYAAATLISLWAMGLL